MLPEHLLREGPPQSGLTLCSLTLQLPQLFPNLGKILFLLAPPPPLCTLCRLPGRADCSLFLWRCGRSAGRTLIRQLRGDRRCRGSPGGDTELVTNETSSESFRACCRPGVALARSRGSRLRVDYLCGSLPPRNPIFTPQNHPPPPF